MTTQHLETLIIGAGQAQLSHHTNTGLRKELALQTIAGPELGSTARCGEMALPVLLIIG